MKKLDNIEKDVRMTKVLTLQNRQKLQSEYGTSLSDVIMGIAQNTK
ncbi:MAG: hypothetical protein LRY68_05180 [Sulfurospirillum sp.]|nr:hypothetical protein [Sulfurospirillum sp.]